MEIKDYLLDELKRLNRQNDLLEKQVNKSDSILIPVYEAINKNTLAMCEIAKVLI